MKLKITLIETIHNKLYTVPIIPGQVINCTDSNEIFYDSSDSKRIIINNAIIILNSEDERIKIINPLENKLYLVKESNNTYIYLNGWVCISSSLIVPSDNAAISPNAETTILEMNGIQYSPKVLTKTIFDTDGKTLDAILSKKADLVHTHLVKDIVDFPKSLPANGGTAEFAKKLSNEPKINGVSLTGDSDIKVTADPNPHAHLAKDITDFPKSLLASGGNADTIGNKFPSDFAPSGFGIGESLTTRIEGINVNTISKGGFYISNGGNMNAPESGPFFLLVGGAPLTCQLFIFINNNHIYYRIYDSTNSTWNNIQMAKLSDLPLSLPANGGNSDRLGGKLADEYALKYNVNNKASSVAPSVYSKGLSWSTINNEGYPCTNGNLFTLKTDTNTTQIVVENNESGSMWIRCNKTGNDAFEPFRELAFKDQIPKSLTFTKDVSGNVDLFNKGDNLSVDINVNQASILRTKRKIQLLGDVLGQILFNGSEDALIDVVLKDIGITPGDYTKVTVDKNGRVIEGSNPSTLDEYGITDGVNVLDVVETPSANKLLKLNSDAKVPADITGDAITLGGKGISYFATEAARALLASALDTLTETVSTNKTNTDNAITTINNLFVSVATANKILKLNAAGKLPADITGDAITLGGKGISYFATEAGRLALDNALTALINTVSTNKTNTDNDISTLSNTVSTNKTNTDSSITNLINSLSILSNTVSSNKTNTDSTIQNIQTSISNIKGYIKVYNAGTAKVSTIALPTEPSFNKSSDSLFVFKNSVLLSSTDYTISSDSKSITAKSTDDWYSDGDSTIFTFIILKNIQLTIL